MFLNFLRKSNEEFYQIMSVFEWQRLFFEVSVLISSILIVLIVLTVINFKL